MIVSLRTVSAAEYADEYDAYREIRIALGKARRRANVGLVELARELRTPTPRNRDVKRLQREIRNAVRQTSEVLEFLERREKATFIGFMGARHDELDEEICRYVEAIGSGLFSATLKAKLEAAEAEKARLAATPAPAPVNRLPAALARFRAMAKDPERARDLVRRLVGSVRLVRVPTKGEAREVRQWELHAELEIAPPRDYSASQG